MVRLHLDITKKLQVNPWDIRQKNIFNKNKYKIVSIQFCFLPQ